MKMTRFALLLTAVKAAPIFATSVAIPLPVGAPVKAPDSQFISRVYFVIHESNPVQIQRGRKLIEQQFADTISAVPQLQAQNYQVVADGNQLVFSMTSQDDTRVSFQNAVSELVGQINGRFRTRGRYDFMRTSLEPQQENYLEVVLDDSNTKIRSIVARAITLRDLLAELKMQFGDTTTAIGNRTRFSYMIPGECASREIDWSFGTEKSETGGELAPKSLEEAMNEVAKVMSLKVQNHQGTFIFTGDCPRSPRNRPVANALDFLPARWIPLNEMPTGRPMVAEPSIPAVPVRMTK